MSNNSSFKFRKHTSCWCEWSKLVAFLSVKFESISIIWYFFSLWLLFVVMCLVTVDTFSLSFVQVLRSETHRAVGVIATIAQTIVSRECQATCRKAVEITDSHRLLPDFQSTHRNSPCILDMSHFRNIHDELTFLQPHRWHTVFTNRRGWLGLNCCFSSWRTV